MRRIATRPLFIACLCALLPAALLAARALAEDPNAFNRLHTGMAERNPPPATDGLHDPAIADVGLLQAPKEAFATLPKAVGGNNVDWTAALKDKKISPRYDKTDTTAQPELLDLDVIRECKGTTPDVIYSHSAHAEWIDCPVCHPAIFESAKGANTMTMAEIMAGEKCGACHGSVAFPVSDCKRCHAVPKSADAKKASASQGKKGGRFPW